MLAVLEADAQRDFRLGWSRWRRIHQAVAARCHAARRALTHAAVRTRRPAAPSATPVALTDAEWDRVCSLLPPQRGRPGRPPHDHRTVLTGILSVVRTGGSWREVPAACGKWETAYKRYRLWQDTGLWPQIMAALDEEASEVSL
jgi:transposase